MGISNLAVYLVNILTTKLGNLKYAKLKVATFWFKLSFKHRSQTRASSWPIYLKRFTYVLRLYTFIRPPPAQTGVTECSVMCHPAVTAKMRRPWPATSAQVQGPPPRPRTHYHRHLITPLVDFTLAIIIVLRVRIPREWYLLFWFSGIKCCERDYDFA